METDTMKLLLLCFTIITLIFDGIGFRDGKKPSEIPYIFGFIVNILFLIGFIIGIISPQQPMIYMIACFAEGFFFIIGIILAIVCFVLVGIAPSANERVNRVAAETTIVDWVLCLSEGFICGLIAYFSFKVWELGG